MCSSRTQPQTLVSSCFRSTQSGHCEFELDWHWTSEFVWKIINNGRHKRLRLRVGLRTANETSQLTVGRLSADITIHDWTESISLLLIPSLKKNLYVCADFVRKLELTKGLVSFHMSPKIKAPFIQIIFHQLFTNLIRFEIPSKLTKVTSQS